MKAVVVILALLSVIALITGAIFKIQHWPNGQTLIYSGAVGCIFAVFFAILFKKQ